MVEGADTDELEPVDEITVHVLVDNMMDILSAVPDTVTAPVPNLLKAGATKLSGPALCCPHWGLSLLITARRGNATRTLLFDTGPDPETFERNVDRLGVELGGVGAVVLSHGHWDHGGALAEAVGRIYAENGTERVPVHMNDGMLVTRGMRLSSEQVVPFEEVPGVRSLSDRGAGVVRDGQAKTLLDGTFALSGEVPRVTGFEQGMPNHVCWSDDDNDWRPDPLIMDERYLAVHVREKGIVVFSACSHAGIVNVLTDAERRLSPAPIYGVMGGLHLSGSHHEANIGDTVEGMKGFEPKRIVVGHCTGLRAIRALYDAFGEDALTPSSVGATFRF